MTRAAPGERRAAREKAKLARSRRGQAIAVISTIVVFGGAAAIVLNSSGWPVVQEQFFSPEAFKTSFPRILEGFWLDIKMFMVIEVAVLIIGLLIALLRTTGTAALFPMRMLAAVYCDVFRGTPVVILIYLFGFGLPALELSGVPKDPILLAGIALTMAYSAYVAEVFRAGITSIHQTQTDAALAVGLTRVQALRYVVLPQAIRRVRPPILNDFISLQKDVALVSILGILEAFKIAQIETNRDFNYTPLIAAALLYLVVTIPMARILDHITARGEINS
ncbi:MAG TPA: amino acid ABC transporter permease [Solirubrobacterales bacterium]|nr:amino acid ABC transporter permease [Solirubrobacterales bacterium]